MRSVDIADKEGIKGSRSAQFVPRCDEVSTSTSDDLRCPHCAAHVTAAAEWCTLCYADLRAPAKPTADEPESKPKGRPEAAAPSVDSMLAQLAAAESTNPLGRFSGVVDTPAKKGGLMVGGAMVAMCLLFILMAVSGALL